MNISDIFIICITINKHNHWEYEIEGKESHLERISERNC